MARPLHDVAEGDARLRLASPPDAEGGGAVVDDDGGGVGEAREVGLPRRAVDRRHLAGGGERGAAGGGGDWGGEEVW